MVFFSEGSARFRGFLAFILIFASLSFPASMTLPDQSGTLFVTLGSGLPNMATVGTLYCPNSKYFLQAGGGSFFLKQDCWKADLSGGLIIHDFLTKNSLSFAGIGYTYYHFLGSMFDDKDAYKKYEADHFATVSFNYAKFFQSQSRFGWTTGISLNASSSGFIPEFRVGLILQAL